MFDGERCLHVVVRMTSKPVELDTKYPNLSAEVLACLIPSVIKAMESVSGSSSWTDTQFAEWYRAYNIEMENLIKEIMRTQG